LNYAGEPMDCPPIEPYFKMVEKWSLNDRSLEHLDYDNEISQEESSHLPITSKTNGVFVDLLNILSVQDPEEQVEKYEFSLKLLHICDLTSRKLSKKIREIYHR
jgi:hypothetical protein